MNTAKLFMNGRSQAVRLPKEFRFETDIDEVLIRKFGDVVMLIPKSKWKSIFTNAIETFPDDVDFSRDQDIPSRDINL